MAKTNKNTAIQAVKALKKVRAELEPLQAREKELKEYVKAYLLEHGESLDTVECTAILRKTPKFKVTNEAEALNLAKLLNLDCLKVDGNKFKEAVLNINAETDMNLYGNDTVEVAVRITYRKK